MLTTRKINLRLQTLPSRALPKLRPTVSRPQFREPRDRYYRAKISPPPFERGFHPFVERNIRIIFVKPGAEKENLRLESAAFSCENSKGSYFARI